MHDPKVLWAGYWDLDNIRTYARACFCVVNAVTKWLAAVILIQKNIRSSGVCVTTNPYATKASSEACDKTKKTMNVVIFINGKNFQLSISWNGCFHDKLWFIIYFSSHEHTVPKVSYCDVPLSVVHRPSVRPSTISLKKLLLWNRSLDFDQISQEWSLGVSVPQLFTPFRLVA